MYSKSKIAEVQSSETDRSAGQGRTGINFCLFIPGIATWHPISSREEYAVPSHRRLSCRGFNLRINLSNRLSRSFEWKLRHPNIWQKFGFFAGVCRAFQTLSRRDEKSGIVPKSK
jgi:hypothetical protein